jgi:hypothetical protein
VPDPVAADAESRRADSSGGGYLSEASDFITTTSPFTRRTRAISDTAENESRTLLELDSSYDGGLIAQAFAQLGKGQLAQAKETYANLVKRARSEYPSPLPALRTWRFMKAVSATLRAFCSRAPKRI